MSSTVFLFYNFYSGQQRDITQYCPIVPKQGNYVLLPLGFGRVVVYQLLQGSLVPLAGVLVAHLLGSPGLQILTHEAEWGPVGA